MYVWASCGHVVLACVLLVLAGPCLQIARNELSVGRLQPLHQDYRAHSAQAASDVFAAQLHLRVSIAAQWAGCTPDVICLPCPKGTNQKVPDSNWNAVSDVLLISSYLSRGPPEALAMRCPTAEGGGGRAACRLSTGSGH